MSDLEYRCLFGPVASRRLGRSLGVDLVPHKTCSLDCLFCQAGPTTSLTVDRSEYIPVKDVIKEIESWLKHNGSVDFITLSGSGEPTLHSRFGDILDAVHKMCSIKTALLSNGSLFYLPEVRNDACKADLVKLSLSAWDQKSFTEINHPYSDMKFFDVVDGMRKFRHEFTGELLLEIFVLFNFNATPTAMKKIAKLAESVHPDRIQLNTVVRPPAHHSAIPVLAAELEKFAPLFTPRAEVIPEFDEQTPEDNKKTEEKEIIAMLRRRKCSVSDIAEAFNISVDDAVKYIENLISARQIREEQRGDTMYYGA
ncbi:radical SAM protein [Verrucomicrobiota bacterium]